MNKSLISNQMKMLNSIGKEYIPEHFFRSFYNVITSVGVNGFSQCISSSLDNFWSENLVNVLVFVVPLVIKFLHYSIASVYHQF